MPKTTRTYRSGDVCFAKVRGYPPWPAKVEGTADETINKFKYHVFFFGTGETAVLKGDEIFPYFENKTKFDKPVKRKGYKEGLLDLQAYVIHNNLKGDPELEEVDVKETKKRGSKKFGKSLSTENENGGNVTGDSTMNDTTVDTTGADTTLDETMGEDTEDETPAKKTDADNSAESTAETNEEVEKETPAKAKTSPKKGKAAEAGEDFTSDGSEEFNLVIDETPKVGGLMGPKAAGLGKKVIAQKRKKASLDNSSEETPAAKRTKRASLPATSTPVDGSLTSRSGRKIKPKKFADDLSLDDDLARAKAISLTTASPPHTVAITSNPDIDDFKEFADLAGPLYTEEDSEGLPIRDETNHGYKGRVIMVKCPSGQLAKLRIDFLRPTSFPSEKARLQYDEAVARNARKLKSQIKEGSFTIEQYLENCKHIVENQSRKHDEKLEHRKGKLKLVCWLKSEQRILEIDCHLKICLTLTQADVDKCLELLDELGSTVIDPLMLKKHPCVVETIKRLRKYVGNTDQWKMSEEEAVNFKTKASLVRMKAEQLYSKLRSLFCVPMEESFWTAFSKKVEEFRDLTNNLQLKEICHMVEDPTIALCTDELKATENDDAVVPESNNADLTAEGDGEDENMPPEN